MPLKFLGLSRQFVATTIQLLVPALSSFIERDPLLMEFGFFVLQALSERLMFAYLGGELSFAFGEGDTRRRSCSCNVPCAARRE